MRRPAGFAFLLSMEPISKPWWVGCSRLGPLSCRERRRPRWRGCRDLTPPARSPALPVRASFGSGLHRAQLRLGKFSPGPCRAKSRRRQIVLNDQNPHATPRSTATARDVARVEEEATGSLPEDMGMNGASHWTSEWQSRAHSGQCPSVAAVRSTDWFAMRHFIQPHIWSKPAKNTMMSANPAIPHPNRPIASLKPPGLLAVSVRGSRSIVRIPTNSTLPSSTLHSPVSNASSTFRFSSSSPSRLPMRKSSCSAVQLPWATQGFELVSDGS